MGFKAIDKMMERVETARQDSDTVLFINLLYLGEMVTKTAAAGLIAGIVDDRERHRYRQMHRLVRADGLGDWSASIEDVLTGTTSQHLQAAAREEHRELLEKSPSGTWQYEAISQLYNCLDIISISADRLQNVVKGYQWFSFFAQLRNKTRGHGAPPSANCSRACTSLEKSIKIIIDNFRLFKREWVFLHRNLSGKYRVTKLSEADSLFAPLKSSSSYNFQDGVYIYYDQPSLVELIKSDPDAYDYFFANGGFTSKKYELISYISGNKIDGDSTSYLAPATELPKSETEGLGSLEVQGKCFSNLPPVQTGYIRRSLLEDDLMKALLNDRHPVVTLVGRGGIGKTSLALSVLQSLTRTDRYHAILWFSARDIDLLPQGPKLVKPKVLTESDIATEFAKLVGSSEVKEKKVKAKEYFARELTQSSFGPFLVVFDNFETVRNPLELFSWMDTYVRLPNKILITTRFRDFKGDFPIEVSGMIEDESDALIEATATNLGVKALITKDYKHQVWEESDGHPYVIKVFVGEVAKAKHLVKIEKIIATKEEILDALFERTYVGLSPAAKRVYLTLCNWRTTIPQLAIEAVLLRPGIERMDVPAAIEELEKSSFIEVTHSHDDKENFINVPLAAAIFGERKLAVDPIKSAVEVDTKLMQAFGAAQQSDIRHGISPRIHRLFRQVAALMSSGKASMKEYLPMLEFIARRYYPAWLLLASLHEETGLDDAATNAKNAVRHYLEYASKDSLGYYDAWKKLSDLCRIDGDLMGELHSLLEISQLEITPFNVISDAANRFNAIFRLPQFQLDTEEKEHMIRRLTQVMKARISEADATDLSRLAWLHLHLHEEEDAKRYTVAGLQQDCYNEYCLKLAKKLHVPMQAG